MLPVTYGVFENQFTLTWKWYSASVNELLEKLFLILEALYTHILESNNVMASLLVQ